MGIKFTPNLTLCTSRWNHHLGRRGPALPCPGLGLDLFVYKRSSSFMNYNRESSAYGGVGMLPVCCILG